VLCGGNIAAAACPARRNWCVGLRGVESEPEILIRGKKAGRPCGTGPTLVGNEKGVRRLGERTAQVAVLEGKYVPDDAG